MDERKDPWFKEGVFTGTKSGVYQAEGFTIGFTPENVRRVCGESVDEGSSSSLFSPTPGFFRVKGSFLH
jgi:hypothetical protein